MDALFNNLPDIIKVASSNPWSMVVFVIVIIAIIVIPFFYFEGLKVKATIVFIFVCAGVFFAFRAIQQEDTKQVNSSQTYKAQIEKSLDKPLKNPKKIDNLGKPTYLATSPPILHIDEQCSANNPPLKCLWNQQ